VFFTNKPHLGQETEIWLYSKAISFAWLVAEHTTIGGHLGKETELRFHDRGQSQMVGGHHVQKMG